MNLKKNYGSKNQKKNSTKTINDVLEFIVIIAKQTTTLKISNLSQAILN